MSCVMQTEKHTVFNLKRIGIWFGAELQFNIRLQREMPCCIKLLTLFLTANRKPKFLKYIYMFTHFLSLYVYTLSLADTIFILFFFFFYIT